MAKNSVISVEERGNMLIFRGAGREIALNSDILADDIRERAILHGLKQKVVDAAAISRNPATGASATADEKMAAIEAMVGRLASGQWNGSSGTGGGTLLDALCIAYPNRERAELRDWLAGKEEKVRKALRVSARLRPIIDELTAKRAGNGAGNDLLDELE